MVVLKIVSFINNDKEYNQKIKSKKTFLSRKWFKNTKIGNLVLINYFFKIVSLYLPFHHYFLLFSKIGKNKLPLIWQILNIPTCLTLVPLIFLIWVIIFLPLLSSFFDPILLLILNLISIFMIFVLLLYTAKTLLGCYFVW